MGATISRMASDNDRRSERERDLYRRLLLRAKTFREDLFFRLQVLPIRLPTLAERAADLPMLAAH